jgi:hypothetical protein
MLADAAEGMTETLRNQGLITLTGEPLAAAYVALATTLDNLGPLDPGKAALFREFRNYHDALCALGGEDGDSLDDLLAKLSAEVGNTKAPRPADQG